MQNKFPGTKSTKTVAFYKQTNKDRNQSSYKQLPIPLNISKLELLQQKLQSEILTRMQRDKQLSELIKHLQASKKSKVPLRYEKITSKKFVSPQKKTVKQNASNTTADMNNSSKEFKKDYEDLIVMAMEKIEEIHHELNDIRKNEFDLEQNFREVCKNQVKSEHQISEKLKTMSQQNSFLEQRVQNQNIQLRKQFKNSLENLKQSLKIELSDQEKIINHLQSHLKSSSLKFREQINTICYKIQETQNRQTMEEIKAFCHNSMKILNQKVRDMTESCQTNICHIENVKQQMQNKLMISIREQGNMNKKMAEKAEMLFQQQIMKLDGIIKMSLDSLKNTQHYIENNFEKLEKEVKTISDSIIETKQSLAYIFYSEKQDIPSSSVSIDIPNFSTTSCSNHIQKPKSGAFSTHNSYENPNISEYKQYTKDTLKSIGTRVTSLQTSMGIVFKEYINTKMQI